jgi:sodium-dependent phosphate cotransporter
MDEPHDPTSQAPIPAQRQPTSGNQPPAGVETTRSAEPKRAWWQHVNLRKIALFLVSLYLFILAITLMKDGARALGPLVRNLFAVNSPSNALGFGWLSAYIIMSGSPIAAASLTLFDAGIIDKLGAFAMINGSRLGASFIVLFIGFLYVLRGRNRATSLSMGLLSLTVTAITHLPAFFLGLWILHQGILDGVQLQSGALLNSVTDVAVGPISDLVTNLLPTWAIFLVGLGISMASFSLFDRCLPQATMKESQVGWMSRLVYRPWVMFLVGCLITTISMSVSISLSILVPLSARGFVRRENVIPYIMGANITTFVDTLLAAVLLKNPEAFTIVLVVMVSVAVICMLVLILFYNRFQHRILVFVEWVTAKNRNLAIFMVGIFLVPILLMVL